jgi:hypothetical protein
MNKKLVYLILMSPFFYGCERPEMFFIDIKKQEIVSCEGKGFSKIIIEGPSEDITLEGTPPVIHFNEYNDVVRTLVFDSIVLNYKLTLKANETYKILMPVGYDRAQLKVELTTDNHGRVVFATKTNCY